MKKIKWLCILSFLLCIPTYAETSSNIRVLLFGDLKDKYQANSPAISLHAVKPMKVEGTELEFSDVSFSMDAFRIKVKEEKELVSLNALSKKIPGSYIVHRKNESGSVYQLYAGYYKTKEEALNGLAKLAQDAGEQAVVVGNLHLTAGNFSSAAQAEEVKNRFTNKGIPAFVVMFPKQNSAQREVWIGECESEEMLASLKQQVESEFTEFTFSSVQPKEMALLDPGEGTGLTYAEPHFYISGIDGDFLRFQTQDDQGIQVLEKENRIYRGDMELHILNQALGLVNELPLEQYLYGVVGAEMNAKWPKEALKAQAVASRTFSLAQQNKFEIADVVDTPKSQSYKGMMGEKPEVVAAVDETAGEKLTYEGKLIEAIYGSNSGGMTSDPSEVWGNAIPYLQNVESPDEIAAPSWYRAELSDGKTGYVREDLVSPEGTVLEKSVVFREGPRIESKELAKLAAGVKLKLIEKVKQATAFQWTKGPYTASEILKAINQKQKSPITGDLQSLEITKRGPSGRVTEMAANTQKIEVKYPDALRGVFFNLPSTKFEIEISDQYTNEEPKYSFIGYGNGHGVGMSQWGAKALAEQGKLYTDILNHYYKGVVLEKE